MARKMDYVCDVCKKPTKRIVGKLFFTPMISGVSRGVHSNYSHHADVGECCKKKLLNGFNFSARMSKREYAEKRKNGRAAA